MKKQNKDTVILGRLLSCNIMFGRKIDPAKGKYQENSEST